MDRAGKRPNRPHQKSLRRQEKKDRLQRARILIRQCCSLSFLEASGSLADICWTGSRQLFRHCMAVSVIMPQRNSMRHGSCPCCSMEWLRSYGSSFRSLPWASLASLCQMLYRSSGRWQGSPWSRNFPNWIPSRGLSGFFPKISWLNYWKRYWSFPYCFMLCIRPCRMNGGW